MAITPRWLTGDTAFMERCLPAGTQWLDAARVELVSVEGAVHVLVDDSTTWGPIGAVVLDRGDLDLDVSSHGRRATLLMSWMNGADAEVRFDAALALSGPEVAWVTVNTEDIRRACLDAAELIVQSAP